MIVIPKEPEEAVLAVERQWDGSACPDPAVRSQVRLTQTGEGLRVRVEAPVLEGARIPAAPAGTRVPNLWEYDVVEVFFAGEGADYLELELGAGGHWLLLAFKGVRKRSEAYEDLELPVVWQRSEGIWRSETVIPPELLPRPVRRLNAFVIARGLFLAHAALPGKEPDFHQPERYPAAALT